MSFENAGGGREPRVGKNLLTRKAVNKDLRVLTYHVIVSKDDVYHIPTSIHQATESKLCHQCTEI